MRKKTQTIAKHSYTLPILLLVLLALCSGCWAGVATYQLDAGTTVPAQISYWLSGNATSVTLEIIDASTSEVVYTFPTITGADAAKGWHPAVVTWNGEADAGGEAQPGNFKVRATVASDMSGTALKPVWESCSADGTNSNGWLIYGVAMNRNPNSPFYGRVYVGNYKNDNGKSRAVWEFNPDGSVIGQLPTPPDGGFGQSGPWGLCVDADGDVFVSNRSDSSGGGAGPAVWRYHWDSDTSQWVCGSTIRGTSYDRYLGCNFASGSALRLVDSYFNSTGTNLIGRLYFGTGDPPSSFAFSGGDKTAGDGFMQPAVDAGGKVYVAGVNWTNDPPTAAIGALTQWDLSGNPANDPTTGSNRNVNLTQATGLAITTDDSTIWLARQARNPFHTYTGIETSDFYKLPKSQAMTITTSSPGLSKYGWGTVYHALSQFPRFIEVDGQSNLLVGGVDSAVTNAGSLFGLYAEPTGPNTTEVRTSRQSVAWGNDHSPEFVSGSAVPSTVACGGTVVVDVTGRDENSVSSGINDIASCVFYCPALGYGTAGDPSSGTPMTQLTGPDEQKQNTYRLTVSIPADAPTGPIAADIYLNDQQPSIIPGHGTIAMIVTGGTITGAITEGTTSLPAVGVTVRATKGSFYREAITDSSGAYSINVTPGTGYSVAPVTNSYGNTIPTEYNLQSNWPTIPGTTDWPKTAAVSLGGSTPLSGRVWPLAITQVTYDWAAHSHRLGGRTVCVTGTVLRQAGDLAATPVQKGFGGYYWLADTRYAATEMAVKVNIFSTGSECARGDNVVVVGTFDLPSSYVQGIVTPTTDPVVVSHGNAMPQTRDASSFANATLYGNMIGGYYVMKNKPVARVGTDGEFYVLTGGDSPGIEFRIDMDTIATTGIGYPVVGQVFDIYGVLDELAPWNGLRALRPAEPSDVVYTGLIPNIATAKSKPDSTFATLQNMQVTATPGGGVPSGVMYVEQPNRANAIRVHMSSLPSDVGPGDLVLVQGSMATTVQGERFVEAAYIGRTLSARPFDPVGMNNRDAESDRAVGLFVKVWGKVSDVGPDCFRISDGSPVRIKVMCGSLIAPEAGRTVRVRGVMSKDADGPVVMMRNEQVDWAYGEDAYQPISLPGAFKYARDFLVCGPFADAESVPPAPPGDPIPAQTYRLDHDFIYDATGGQFDEMSMASLKPKLGGSVGTKTWRRSQATGDNADFTQLYTTDNTYCTFYAHVWIYSPYYQDVAMRVGSADSVKVFVDGFQVLWTQACDNNVTPPILGRTELQGSDDVYWAPLYPGFNSVLLKVEHGIGPAGVDFQFVDPYDMGSPGWGGAKPLLGLGYLLDAQP